MFSTCKKIYYIVFHVSVIISNTLSILYFESLSRFWDVPKLLFTYKSLCANFIYIPTLPFLNEQNTNIGKKLSFQRRRNLGKFATFLACESLDDVP